MRKPHKTALIQILIAAAVVAASLPLSAGVYYWTDEKGVKHYSNVAPVDDDREVQQLEEIPPDAAGGSDAAEPPETEADLPADSEEIASEQAPAEPKTEAETTSGEQTSQESAAEAQKPRVPTEMNAIVAYEKAAVKELQRQLEQNSSQQQAFVEKERQRISSALEQLQKTPATAFGSQKNKTRAMGYYKYRLEALQSSPDTYFAYGDSDSD